jgi:hypothetical protein
MDKVDVNFVFQMFGLQFEGTRKAKYVLKSDGSAVESISTSEYHEMTVVLRSEAGGSVEATQELKLIGRVETYNLNNCSFQG